MALQGLEFHRFEPTSFLAGGNQVAVPINVEVTVNDELEKRASIDPCVALSGTHGETRGTAGYASGSTAVTFRRRRRGSQASRQPSPLSVMSP